MTEQATERYQKRDFWAEENLKYSRPHFRLEKAARIVNGIAAGRQCDLLDVGCGPAALMHLVRDNISYHGIDIAIHNPAPNLRQADFLQTPIAFENKQFDIIVAQGVFEYVGKFQAQKFAEIKGLLGKRGTFVASYVNFDHLHKIVYAPYNNVQSFDDFRTSLGSVFHINKVIPTSHHWHHREPTGDREKALQMHFNLNLPVLSRMFAVEYFFLCS
jgi:SAM-dependent methyltransferase